MKFLRGYLHSLVNPKFIPVAFRVAIVVGSLLFVINHGAAAIQGQMTRDRWISATLTYLVPYFVNIHGQLSAVREDFNEHAAISIFRIYEEMLKTW